MSAIKVGYREWSKGAGKMETRNKGVGLNVMRKEMRELIEGWFFELLERPEPVNSSQSRSRNQCLPRSRGHDDSLRHAARVYSREYRLVRHRNQGPIVIKLILVHIHSRRRLKGYSPRYKSDYPVALQQHIGDH